MFKQKKFINSILCLFIFAIALSCTSKQEKQNLNTHLQEEVHHTYTYGICVDSLELNNYTIKGGVLQYRLRILYGHSQIPTLIPRKQTIDRIGHGKGSINKLAYSFKIEKVQVDNYYGFSLDKDQLFLLEDFTICHNSWNDLTTAVVQGRALCEVQGIIRGIQVYGGTGGDIGPALEGLKKISSNPKSDNV